MKKNKYLLFVVLLLTLFILIIMGTVFADTVPSLAFDKTNVMDDLNSSKDFNLLSYPFTQTQDARIINFVEYCYSFFENKQDNYALYVYIYNPKCLNFVTDNPANKIQIAVAYNADGTPKDYEQFDLHFCNTVDGGNYNQLFYKFRVVDHESKDCKTILQRVNSNERRYDVSGFYLFADGKTTDYTVGGTYKFSGYTSGYGADETEGNTLTSVVKDLETIKLDLGQSSYLFQTHINCGKMVNTAYFFVPQRFFNDYGKLQKIKATFYEVKTKDIIVTSDNNVYNGLLPWVGVDIGETNNSVPYSLSVPFMDGYSWSYNKKYVVNDSSYFSSKLMFLFDSVIDNNSFISGVTILDYIKRNSSKYGNPLPVSSKISSNFFQDKVDEGRIKGKNIIDLDADNHYDLLAPPNDVITNWVRFFYPNIASSDIDFSPIKLLETNDIVGGDVADRLLISKQDLSGFLLDCGKNVGKVPVLFRFAVTDFISQMLQVDKTSDLIHLQNKCAYRAQETMFLDFNVIQLTFNKVGNYMVIPVVASPIDIVPAVTSPLQETNWLQLILMILALVLALIFLAPILPYIIRAIIWLITLPFILIGKIFKKRK